MISEIYVKKELMQKLLNDYRKFSTLRVNFDNLQFRLDDWDLIEDESSAIKLLMKHFGERLKANPAENQLYDTIKIPEGPWKLFERIIVASRVEELKNVKVVKKNRKYDISQLRKTYFGKLLLADLKNDIRGKWMLNQKEYNSVLLQCRKLKLDLPEVVEPTTTDKFFED